MKKAGDFLLMKIGVPLAVLIFRIIALTYRFKELKSPGLSPFQGKKETVVYLEKGYLKEHAIGALKLQHKILADIIADHEDENYAPENASGDKEKTVPGGKIIVLEKPKNNA